MWSFFLLSFILGTFIFIPMNLKIYLYIYEIKYLYIKSVHTFVPSYYSIKNKLVKGFHYAFIVSDPL
jgi:hypothetical protein